jgi:hypothetical protein
MHSVEMSVTAHMTIVISKLSSSPVVCSTVPGSHQSLQLTLFVYFLSVFH